MKKLLQPQILIPVVLGAGLIAALLAFSDTKKLVPIMLDFQKVYLLIFLLLTVVYEVVRGVQWHVLLTSMDIRVPVPTQIFSFAAGEVTKSMPIGNYFQNYLLQQSKGTDFGLSSAATTLIILAEVVVSLVGVLILGLGSWTGWVRPVIVVGTAVFLLLAWAYHTLHHSSRAPRWLAEHKTTRLVMNELRQFRHGAAALFQPRTLAIAVLLGAMYLIVAGAGLYFVVRGLGATSLSFPQVLSVYFFSLAFSLIVPIPVDIGVLEISGVGAFLAIGLDRNTAVGAMLINRVLSIGASLAIALVVMIFLHDEFRAALHLQSRRPRASRPTEAGSDPVEVSAAHTARGRRP